MRFADRMSFRHAYFGDAICRFSRACVLRNQGGHTLGEALWNTTSCWFNWKGLLHLFFISFRHLTGKFQIAFSRHTLGCSPGAVLNRLMLQVAMWTRPQDICTQTSNSRPHILCFYLLFAPLPLGKLQFQTFRWRWAEASTICVEKWNTGDSTHAKSQHRWEAGMLSFVFLGH